MARITGVNRVHDVYGIPAKYGIAGHPQPVTVNNRHWSSLSQLVGKPVTEASLELPTHTSVPSEEMATGSWKL